MTINKKMFGLGRGLGSLIPEGKSFQPAASKENVFYVEVAKIEPNPDQPRREFEKEPLEELSRSIRKYGVLQPLLVSKIETPSAKGMDVTYRLIAGERRWRASKLAGLPHVPVIIRDDFKKDRERLEVALIENVQREDLNPVEEAEAYQRLAKEFSLSQREIAEKVSKSREAVANVMRLVNLPDDMKSSLRDGKLSRAHARALLAFSDAGQQRDMYQQILAGGISSRDVETAGATSKAVAGISRRARKTDHKFTELEKNLADTLETKVNIHGAAATGGKIVIKFANLEHLNKIAKNIID